MKIGNSGLSMAAALAVVTLGSRVLAQQTTMTLASSPTARETDVALTADVMYDSNLARSDRELAAQRGLSLADEVFTPSVQLKIARQIGRHIFFLEGDAGYVFHRKDKTLDRQSINLQGGVTSHYARCAELLGGQYSSRQSDLADVSAILGQNSAIVAHNTVQVGDVVLSADCGGAIGLAPVASVQQTWSQNSALQFSLNDFNSLLTTGGLAYRSPELGSLELFGNFSQTNFPHRIQILGAGGTDTLGYDIYSGGLSYDRHLGGLIEGIVSLSYTSLEPNSSAIPSFKGLTFSVDGSYRATPRLTLHASTSRVTSPSNRIDANYSVDQNYQADVTYVVSNRLEVYLVGMIRTRDYHVDLGAPIVGFPALTNDLTHDNSDSVFVSFRYKATRTLSFQLNVGDEERTANFPGSNFSSTRVDFTAKARF